MATKRSPVAVRIFGGRWHDRKNGTAQAPEDPWAALRGMVGAGPDHAAFPTRRRRLEELRAGERFLLIRKLGGLGDILVTSMIFPDLRDQYPDIETTYAIPKLYHPLFAGSGVRVIDYADVYGRVGPHYGPDSEFHRSGIRRESLETYDLIEDISRPCHHWEVLMRQYQTIDGARGLTWRNRLDRWTRWFGLTVRNPRTCIRLDPTEITAMRARFPRSTKPVLLWSPVSAGANRSYPWFSDVTHALSQDFSVVYLHHEAIGPSTLTGLSLREMGAACAAADCILSVDTSTFHWGGILHKPTVGLFNLLLGESHAQYYPTARTLQLCPTPCIGAYYPDRPICGRAHGQRSLQGAAGRFFSACYFPGSVVQIADAVRALWREPCATS